MNRAFDAEDVGTVFFNFERAPLQHLVLSNFQLNLESWNELSKSLKTSSITHLEIHMSSKSLKKEIEAFGDSLYQTPVQKLTLASHSMEPSHIKMLFEKIKKTSINELDFYMQFMNETVLNALIANLGNITTLHIRAALLNEKMLEKLFTQLKNTNVTTIELGGGLIHKFSKKRIESYLKDSHVIQVSEEPDYGEKTPKILWERNNTLEQLEEDKRSLEDSEYSESFSNESSGELSDNSPEESSQEVAAEKNQSILEKQLHIGLKESSEIMEKTMKELKDYHRFLETILQEALDGSDQFTNLKEIHQLEEKLLEKRFEKSQKTIEKSFKLGLKESHKISEKHSKQDDGKNINSTTQKKALSFFNSLPKQNDENLELESITKDCF